MTFSGVTTHIKKWISSNIDLRDELFDVQVYNG